MWIRPLREDEWDRIAALIHVSTNTWYARHLNKRIFPEPPSVCRIFPEVYERLDPGFCWVAEEEASGRLMGSCFVHPRETHVSLGIMNADPYFAGRGVCRAILREICAFADARGLPVRLVASAMNLDSFSLYTREGFSPRAIFQDMLLGVPAGGPPDTPPLAGRVRPAAERDLPEVEALDFELAGVRRPKDFRYMLADASGLWRLLVLEGAAGRLDGFLASLDHPGSLMLGPGAARDASVAEALIWRQWDLLRGKSPAFLVPAAATALVGALYRRGARNCELHLLQARGDIPPLRGIVMPTFMPETL
jgi:RimJ/RimL family protein N-acetyltransferase